ncbi:hypothetical protein GQR58_019651 [Nymphon striatum]|nr:hypothetical protein GQR58_019651 [Nymphon striatum]
MIVLLVNLSTPSASINKSEPFSPESVKPHPKAPKRKTVTGNIKRRKTCILTDTPEKKALRKEQQRKLNQKKQKKQQKTTAKKPMKRLTKKQYQIKNEPFSLKSVKPHPKAPKRKIVTGNRKRRKTCILNDTPEKEALRKEQQRKLNQKKQKKTQKTTAKKPMKKLTKNNTKSKRKSACQKPKTDSDSDEK